MYVIRRKRKQGKRVFFLLLSIALILTPFIIAFSLGTNSSVEFSLNSQPARPVQPAFISIANEGLVAIDLYIPMDPQDSWRVTDGQLELYLHEPRAIAAFSPERVWLDQHIQSRHEGSIAVVSFDIDTLPSIFRLLRTEFGYRLEWTEEGLAGRRIALDPGHGGHDPGALGRRLGLKEKDVTLAIALELRTLLEQAGAEVFMTRSTDTLVNTSVQPGQSISPDLWMRRDIVQEWGPDFFLSIHNNSWADSSATGIETYYNRYTINAPNSRIAAELIQDSLVFEIARRDRGVKYKESSDAVLRLEDFPAVLAEILFISNPSEEQVLADPGFAMVAANALFMGIQDYFNPSGGGSR